MAAAFGPLIVFYILVVVLKISATSPKLSAYVIFSQWIAERPLSMRVVLYATRQYPKIDIYKQILQIIAITFIMCRLNINFGYRLATFLAPNNTKFKTPIKVI